MFLIFIITSILCSNSYAFQCQRFSKTPWFNRDNSSGPGDFETLERLRQENPGHICNNPTACEVQTIFGIPASRSGDIVPECSILTGFVCLNAKQKSRLCQDYRIQFTCPATVCDCKTKWFDRDDPSGLGDFEDLVNLRKQYPGQICSNPTACEVQTLSGVPALSSGDNIIKCSISSGFACVNADQKDGSCEDYRIRFTCPKSYCNCKTQWFDRDDPSGFGDFEDLVNLRKDYPGQICSNPTACEVETLSGDPASSSGDNITECSISSGFACVNQDQKDRKCEDYRIRFTCPESFCNCKTQWFDRDDPSANGDFEDLVNLQNEYPGQICRNPVACEVETVSGIPASNSGDNITPCSISTGFSCVNEEQKDGSCEDYRIRFICPESFCNCKTKWFDRDDPSGFGDVEDLVNLRKDYPGQICSNPTACEVETISGDPASSSGDNITECSITSGFACVNKDQKDGKCEDYRIRFTCPESFCNCKTQWFDRDDPSGFGDFEDLVNLRKDYPGQICSNPTACEVETLSGDPASSSGDNITECRISSGFVCVNQDQKDGKCEDYRIRFTCPESFCNCKTQWFDRDDPSANGDFEDLVNLQNEYPGQICRNPVACEVETVSGIPASNSGDNITPCSISTGFSCVNEKQKDGSCEDYRIRFICPESFCNCKTKWFDRDDPSGFGDVEDLVNLRKDYPGQICSNPTACEVETISGDPATSSGDNITECSVTSGFACVNKDQKDEKCEDYRIRFTCPESFCNCKTQWFDRDDPSRFGDFENLVNLRKEYPGQICSNPTACEVETISGVPASTSGDNITECRISSGFACVNRDQKDGKCEDYRIRFTCPESFCNCKTQWFDRDDPSANGDFEDLVNLQNEYPGQICRNPVACEVETVSGIPASNSGDIITPCSISTGFSCVNEKQKDGSCEDYRIRFICPESFCNCKTQWFDRDDPSGFGDFEDLVNLRKDYPGQICSNPTACEVETLSGDPASSSGDNITECSISSGFACVNQDQKDRKCEDYRIRFTCPESFCNCKTQWFDRDDPSANGDFEDLVNLQNEYPGQICRNPVACEVETVSGIPASNSGDNITPCSISTGFSCVNEEQKDGSCEDYRIRFICPESFCNCKTQWFDRDDPSGFGDFEDLVNLRKDYPGQICSNPTACEVETLSGDPASSSGDNITECSISSGFACVNQDQKDRKCEDYRIRFTCPESFCNCKTQWFDRDDPSANGDFEDLVNLQNEYPGQICRNPVACEVETVSGIPASNSGDIITPCSISTGFSCVNEKQKDGSCEDYRIRFICPESFCNCKTQWFDRDDPSGFGDFEDLVNLRKDYPGQICSNPTACEVETLSGDPASSSGDNITECSISSGFACVNQDQKDRKCEDYRIRFTCPESFCNCKTQWFDRDDPSANGDFEDLVNLQNEYPGQICRNPVACEVETVSGIPASNSGDIITPCSISTGFSCVNEEQKDGSCEDYRIRFICPESFCNCKTQWFDRDDPLRCGDFENLVNLRKDYPGQICSNPTACEVETISGVPASTSGDNITECSVTSGFVCVNKDQKDRKCEDYRIRFTCPESFCNCKTQWFDRDDPSANGDSEDLVNLQNEYPGQICRNPVACEVETVSGIPASNSGDNITPCSISTGFSCVNEKQKDGSCEDYRIRFICPESFCNCKTQWFDRDDPSGNGDYENLVNLQKEYPGQMCSNPTACEVETISGVPASSSGDIVSECSISTGFTCVNKDQKDGKCEDYRIRFTCPESFCNCKTKWFDRDNPSGNGDYENLVNLRKEHPGQICSNPTACEVETISEVPASSSGDIVSECSISSGFICVNEEQTDRRCEDYRIRFTCPESFCNCKTQWFDRDNPSGFGDYENLVNLRKEYPRQICSNPTACEVQTISEVPASSSGDIIAPCSILSGFTCVNAEQTDGRCEDYRIRFTCPESFCNCKTQWFDRDNPSGNGDFENLVNLRKEYPGQICSNPTACEVQTISGVPASNSGDIIALCSILSGFTCVNKEQRDGRCEDYRIRFTCPESFCNCKTQWFDRDDPSGDGDYENLANLRKQYPGQMCRNPTACEVETISGVPASSSGDNITECSVSTGFTCVNEEQEDGRCEDYRIRFTCPESFCNCKTQWFDRDDPSGKGDYEVFVNLQNEYPGQICRNPVACEVETVSGIPASNSGDNIAPCSISSGFTCVNEEQEDGRCKDYKIRFTCPESFCKCTTEWFDRDNPTGVGDHEDFANLQKEFPGQICCNPIACEVETTSGIPASSSGDNISPCSISSGFTCVNKDQNGGKCEDYRIRFTCPKSFCNCITQWFDRDDPSGKGDFEDLLNLQREHPDQICSNPTACEVQTISGIPDSRSDDNIPQCSISAGFTCINAEQKNGRCEDYRIRFTCPKSFCNCKTKWFDRDNPSGIGDFEDLVNLRKEHPGQICSNPTACEVQTISGVPASSSGDIVSECSISSGFTCVNAEQKDKSCHDYRIRFTCPKSFCSATNTRVRR